MLHAWLGFLLLLTFYVVSFGLPGRSGGDPVKADQLERNYHQEDEDRMAIVPD